MEILDFIIRGRSVLAQNIAALYGGESGVSTLRFTGADASKTYKLDLLNEWNGQKNVLDLQNDGGTLSVALTGAASIPAGGYLLQLRTVGETVWHSDPVRLTVRTPIDAVDAFDPNVPSEMRQLEQRATEAAAAAETAQGKAEDAQTAAETAQGKAEDAKTAAETAQGKAEDAQTAAETAQGKAENAQTAAETAQGKAENAQTAAEAAVGGKMDKADPTGTGSLSLNRKPDTTVGLNSVTAGSVSADTRNEASGQASVALGAKTVASGAQSVALGAKTVASGGQSVALGNSCAASGKNAVALGIGCEASGENSVAEGRYTVATGSNQHVFGRYNAPDADMMLIVGNGGNENNRRNAMTLDGGGNAVFAGTVTAGGRQLGGYIVFRIVGFDTYTLFCAAGTTWAQLAAGDGNPVVTLSDGESEYLHGRLLSVSGGYVYGKSNANMLDDAVIFGTVPLHSGTNLVASSSCPADGATYKLEAE